MIKKLKRSKRRSMNFYPLYKVLTKPFYQGIFIKTITGKKNIPKNGPLIVASNHQSHLDPLAVIMSVRRPIRFIVAAAIYKNWFLNIILRSSRQIRFDRKSSESKEQMNKEIEKTMQNEEVLGIFPEGIRTPRDELAKAYPGVGRFAVKHKVAVVPVGIKGSYETWPKHKRFPHFRKQVEVFIGKPMNVHEMPEVVQSANPEEEATRQVMKTIGKLIDQEYKY
ncbi:lysophospholipid acyltransferase family protein [Patescibacteria group bacterium]